MTPRDLLAAFDVLAEAPGGTQRLRALVLELAVRGKLVPQDPRDEPASALLERIAAEKARLVKEGKIRAPKPLPPVGNNEVPFEVPERWRWCRLDDLLVDGPSNGWSPKAVPFETKTRTLSLSATTRGVFDPAQYKYVEAELPPDSPLWLRNGDLLIQRSNTPEYVGMAAIYDRADSEFIYPDLMMRCRLSRSVSTHFVHRFLLSASGRGWFQARASGTSQSMVKVGQQVVRSTPTPVAPLAEQRRIVARVDELLAVLDRLEAARGAREAARVGLRDAALAALRNAPDAAAVEVAWARVAERMDELFSAPADVAPLRQTILQLAVRGRLMPQDARDEPANVLLDRIAAEKARMVKHGKLRASKPVAPVNKDQVPFHVPPGWAWCRLSTIAQDIRYGYTASADHNSSSVRFLRITDIQNNAVNWTNVPGCDIDKETLENYRLTNDDIVIARTGGTVGKSYLICNLPKEVTAVFASYLIRIRPASHLIAAFLKQSMETPLYWEQLLSYAAGTGQPNVNATSLGQLLLPLPPLPEQHRIVAKVDELMGLCDQLEARLRAVQETQAAFAAAAVHHLDS